VSATRRDRTRLLGLAAAGLLAACGSKDTGPATTEVPKVVKKASTAVTQQQDAAPQFSYSPVGKRDPFYSYLAEVQATNDTHTERKREATESFELDQYRLTGLVTGTAQPRAMVEDPDGKGHVVSINSRLGKRGGIVTRITNEGIIVTEEFRTPTGDKVRVPITIKLPQPELEGNGAGQ
jgi:type IV pilus assembly protein PilP